MGDIMHLEVPPEKRESFVTECGDDLDLDTCWWMSPLGHAAHMKIMLKKSTHKVREEDAGTKQLTAHRLYFLTPQEKSIGYFNTELIL